jgi:hypothetical protein
MPPLKELGLGRVAETQSALIPVVVGFSISSSRLLFAVLAACGGDAAFFRLETVLQRTECFWIAVHRREKFCCRGPPEED